MTREEAIEILKSTMIKFKTLENGQEFLRFFDALEMAISSLETDEAYQLEYERTTKNDLGVDAVSRKEVFNQIFYSTDNNGDVVLGSVLRERIARLPSVTPQEPKTGHWILDETDNSITCDKCGCLIWANDISNGEANFCPNCGAKMDKEQNND